MKTTRAFLMGVLLLLKGLKNYANGKK